MSRSACTIGRDYVVGSFKGVLFEAVNNAEAEGGRRGAEGEFPFGEQTAYADLGRKIRRYHISAIFRDDSHISDSQALFDACQSPGPGMLVHPTRGTAMVACKEVKVKDNPEEPGETYVEMEFVEANVSGGLGALGAALFGIISTGLGAASQASFLAGYAPQFVSQPWRNDVVATAQSLITAVATAVSQVTPPTAPVSTWRSLVSMQTIAEDSALASDPVKVDRALTYGVSAIPVYVSDSIQRYGIFRSLVNIAARTSTLPPGPAEDSENAVLQRHRVLNAIGMAEAAMATQYSTVNDVLTTMDQVTMVFEDEMTATYSECDNAQYLELRNYLIQFQSMMNTLAYRLPPIIEVNFVGGIQPLVAAYAIYGDAKRSRELEPRNPINASGQFNFMVNAAAPN